MKPTIIFALALILGCTTAATQTSAAQATQQPAASATPVVALMGLLSRTRNCSSCSISESPRTCTLSTTAVAPAAMANFDGRRWL